MRDYTTKDATIANRLAVALKGEWQTVWGERAIVVGFRSGGMVRIKTTRDAREQTIKSHQFFAHFKPVPGTAPVDNPLAAMRGY